MSSILGDIHPHKFTVMIDYKKIQLINSLADTYH